MDNVNDNAAAPAAQENPMHVAVQSMSYIAHRLKELDVRSLRDRMQSDLIAILSDNPKYAAEYPMDFANVVATIEYLTAGCSLVTSIDATLAKQIEAQRKYDADQNKDETLPPVQGDGAEDVTNKKTSGNGEAAKKDVPPRREVSRTRPVRK